MTTIIQRNDQKMLAINGMPDHVHFFIGMKPECRLSDLVKEVKLSTNAWINENKFTTKKFYWQEGFGAFTYGQSQIDTVVRYIHNQKEHHKKNSFKGEYMSLLKKFEIDFNEKYLFDWYE